MSLSNSVSRSWAINFDLAYVFYIYISWVFYNNLYTIRTPKQMFAHCSFSFQRKEFIVEIIFLNTLFMNIIIIVFILKIMIVILVINNLFMKKNSLCVTRLNPWIYYLNLVIVSNTIYNMIQSKRLKQLNLNKALYSLMWHYGNQIWCCSVPPRTTRQIQPYISISLRTITNSNRQWNMYHCTP